MSNKFKLEPNNIYVGDCLDILKYHALGISPDVIYWDPPWSSGRNYNVQIKNKCIESTSQTTAFKDIWGKDAGSTERLEYFLDGADEHPCRDFIKYLAKKAEGSEILSYATWAALRIPVMHEMLKSTGLMWYHCDWRAEGVVRHLMDDVFGRENLINVITWCYSRMNNGKNHFPRQDNRIFLYGKSNDISLRTDLVKVDLSRIDKKRYGWGKLEDVEEWERDEIREGGTIPRSWWTDIAPTYKMGKEWSRWKYSTQKPEDLLKRIVFSSCPPGGLVLDPSCGSGTALLLAQRFGAKFIGIDISLYAANICAERLYGDFDIKGIPKDLSTWRLIQKDPFEFERLAVEFSCKGVLSNKKQVGDGGIDGRGELLIPSNGKSEVIFQVKSGNKPTASKIRDFKGLIDRKGVAAGVFITIDKSGNTNEMKRAAAELGSFKVDGSDNEYPKLQHWSLEHHYEGIPVNLPQLKIAHDVISRQDDSDKQIDFLMER